MVYLYAFLVLFRACSSLSNLMLNLIVCHVHCLSGWLEGLLVKAVSRVSFISHVPALALLLSSLAANHMSIRGVPTAVTQGNQISNHSV